MKTTEKRPQTKDKLLDAAHQLMLGKGYVATTVDEICEAAKVTKGSFFHYFESKDDLAETLLERVCESSSPLRGPELTEKDPLKRIYARIDFVIEMVRKCGDVKGCIVGTFGQELSDTHPKIRELCRESFNLMAKQFVREITG